MACMKTNRNTNYFSVAALLYNFEFQYVSEERLWWFINLFGNYELLLYSTHCPSLLKMRYTR